MPRPFPFPFSIGTDICSIDRIFTILTRNQSRHAHGFLKRLLNEKERIESKVRINPPLQEWIEIARKRTVLEKKRVELGMTKMALEERKAEKNRNEGKQQRQRREKRVDHTDIMLLLDREIEEEEIKVRESVQKMAGFVAGRFAAKEAAIKAYRSRKLTYHDITIQKQGLKQGMTQAPIAVINAENGVWEDGQIVPMTISHDGDYATAVCMAYESTDPLEKSRLEVAQGCDLWRKQKEKDMAAAGSGIRRPASVINEEKLNKARDAAIFVGNLAHQTTDQELVKAFSGLSSFTRGYVCRGTGGESLGYGFVVLANCKDAMNAVQLKNLSLLRGKNITCGRARNSKADIALQFDGNSTGFVEGKEGERENIFRSAKRYAAREKWEKWRELEMRRLDLNANVPPVEGVEVRRIENFVKWTPGWTPTRVVKDEEVEFWTDCEDLLRQAMEEEDAG